LISTITDARVYLLSPEFQHNNPELEHERGLLITGKLEVVHVSHPPGTPVDVKAFVHLHSPMAVLQPDPVDATEAKVWYRAMPRSEYLYLKRFGKVQQDASYGGIATNASYGLATMSSKSETTHLVEFDLRCFDKTFYHQLRDAAHSLRQAVQEPNAGGDGDSFGLGMSGHYSGQAGKFFNELLTQGSWRLLHVILPLK
jgi:hypothetical protein